MLNAPIVYLCKLRRTRPGSVKREQNPHGPTSSPHSRPIVVWLAVSSVAVLLGGGWLIGLKLGHTETKPALPLPAPNPAGAVSLAAFADRESQRWQSAPRGTQVCDGVAFVCSGAVRIAGLRAARDGKRFPGAVLGIPLGRRGSRVHLLQAAENAEEMSEGVPYGRIVLHYANGESKRVDLLLGMHGEDWLQRKGAPNEPLADPNSRLAWSQRRSGDGRMLRLYHTVMENPIPSTEITALDCISPLTEANLLVFGVAVDDDPRPLSPSHGAGEVVGDAPIFDLITFTLRDPSEQAAAGGKLAWTAVAPRAPIQFPAFPADLEGMVRLEVPRRAIKEIQYNATGTGGLGATGSLQADSGGMFPQEVLVKLGKE